MPEARGQLGQHCALIRMLVHVYRFWCYDQIQNELKLSVILCNSKFSALFQSSRRRNIQVMPFVEKNTVIFDESLKTNRMDPICEGNY